MEISLQRIRGQSMLIFASCRLRYWWFSILLRKRVRVLGAKRSIQITVFGRPSVRQHVQISDVTVSSLSADRSSVFGAAFVFQVRWRGPTKIVEAEGRG